MTPPATADDLFILVLTDTDYLYSLALHFQEQNPTNKKEKPSRELRFVGGSEASGEKRVNIREAMAKKTGETMNGTTLFKQVQV